MGEKIKALKTATIKQLVEFWHTFKSGSWLKSPIFWARFMAYAIPLGFLLYVLYMNFLPFGYNKTFTIDVGSENDTKVSEFYLEPSKDLSERKTDTDANSKQYTYRELSGVAYAVFKPNAVLKNAEVTVSVEGEGVSIIPPVIDFKPEDVKWDYSWDFTQGKKPEELGLAGNAFPFDGAMYFDGKSQLELPNSADKFEDGPFTVYVEWEPQNSEDDFQQIVGHYNWELLQNKKSVNFQIGRMNNMTGPFFSMSYPISSDFFNQKHTALMAYSPKNNILPSGYIDFYIDNNFVGRTYFDDNRIWEEYNSNRNITVGKSDHGIAEYFKGKILRTNLVTGNIINTNSKTIFNNNPGEQTTFLLTSTKNSPVTWLKLNVKK